MVLASQQLVQLKKLDERRMRNLVTKFLHFQQKVRMPFHWVSALDEYPRASIDGDSVQREVEDLLRKLRLLHRALFLVSSIRTFHHPVSLSSIGVKFRGVRLCLARTINIQLTCVVCW